MGYPSLSICRLPVQIRLSSAWVYVSVCVRSLTSLCTPPVSKHALIGSDLGMTHHMPTPHAPSDLHLPLPSFPLSPSIHASLLLTPTHPPSLQVFLCSSPLTFPSGLHIFTHFSWNRLLVKEFCHFRHVMHLTSNLNVVLDAFFLIVKTLRRLICAINF